VIGENHPGMQMISFGPHIVDVHSSSERRKIWSVGPFWAFPKKTVGAALTRDRFGPVTADLETRPARYSFRNPPWHLHLRDGV
jgi:hypothetical protein